jgi:mono/diheme cytochrome c family protein
MKKTILLLSSLVAIVTFLLIRPIMAEKPGSDDNLYTTAIYMYQTPQDKTPAIQDPDFGIGPVKKVALGTIDQKLVDDGKRIFNNKCITCHDMDNKKVGPPLRNITKERTPEYLMNLLVNYHEMITEDPLLKDTFRRYNYVPMTDPLLKQPEARSVLEYLRSVLK